MARERTTLPIFNLSCAGDAQRIERTLAQTAGIAEVYVNPATEMAYVLYERGETDPDRLMSVIAAAGFGAPERAEREALPKGVPLSCCQRGGYDAAWRKDRAERLRAQQERGEGALDTSRFSLWLVISIAIAFLMLGVVIVFV